MFLSVRTTARVQPHQQFDAVDQFIVACDDEPLGGSPSAPSPDFLAALRAMTFETRLGFYRLSEDARVRYVEVLAPPVRQSLVEILRGERDP